jgi:tetratricopeptide (TPR) repeat protein
MNLSFQHLRGLSVERRAAVAAAVDAFDDAWQHHPDPPPELSAFLPDDSDVRIPILIELACIDLERRLKHGLPARVEQYLQTFPELAADADVVWALLVVECTHRGLGVDAAPGEYQRRFPEHQQRLLAWLPTVSPPPGPGSPAGTALRQPAAETGVDPGRTRAETPPRPAAGLPELPGYEVLSVLGHGGMGVVYKARQVRLDRVVALKMILAGGHAGAAELARFQAEAEAVARLQHPGIVQIHETGVHDGLPYFSLEFCSGGSLDRKLQGTPLPPAAAARLIELLAQALQAAHDKGILHRDLKPANVFLMPTRDPAGVLIGERSEQARSLPKIGDFGLAKKLEGTADGGLTRSGAIMGTPSYMAPEQAGGKISALGPATDVYALGALLYECLTGRPPFRAATVMETLRQVTSDEPVPPSRLNPGTPRDLETICLKCLHKEPGRRYGSAQELAEDLERFRNGEPIHARRVGRLERALKWTRRNQALTAFLAAVVLLLAGGAAAGLWYQSDQEARRTDLARRLADTERAVSVALARAEQLRDQAEHLPSGNSVEAAVALAGWHQAEDALGQAETALDTGTADEVLRQRVAGVRVQIKRDQARVRRKAELFRDLDEARMARLVPIDRGFDYSGSAKKYAAAFARHGLDVAAGSRDELARRIAAEEVDVHDALLLALDDWAWNAAMGRTSWSPKTLRELADAADRDPWRKQYRDAVTSGNVAALRDLGAEAPRVLLPPSGVYLLANSLACMGANDEAATLLRWGRSRYPTDFWLQFRLGSVLTAKGRPPLEVEEGIGCYRTALALRPAAGVVHNDLAIALERRDQVDDAIAEYRQALELNPGDALAHSNLGLALQDKKQLDEAIAEFHKAIALDRDGENPHPHNNLGRALRAKYRLDDAIAELRKAIAIDPTFAPAHNGLGVALADKEEWDAAVTEFLTALQLDPQYAHAHHNLGLVLKVNDELDAAVAEFRRALQLDPNLKGAGDDLETALQAKKKLDDAIAEHRKAVQQDPADAKGHNNLGQALAGLHQLDDASAEYRKAIQLDPRLAAAHRNLGQALAGKRQWDDAIAALGKAVELDPRDAQAHYHLGLAWQHKKQWDNAITAYRKAVELDPGNAKAHCKLGNALLAKHQLDDAIAAYRKALDIDPGQSLALNGLGVSLRVKTGQAAWPREAEKAQLQVLTEPLFSLRGTSTGSIESLAFSPDGNWLAAGTAGKTIHVWDLATRTERMLFKGHHAPVKTITFSHDGNRLASSGSDDQTVKVWDVQTGKELFTLKGHNKWIAGVAFSPDDKLLATGGEDQTAKLWDARTGTELKTLTGHNLWVWGVAYSPTGDILASASGDKTIKLWNVATGAEIRTLQGHRDRVRHVAFSPDGKLLASCSWDFTVRLWDTTTGKQIRTLAGHTSFAWCVAFSPDGKYVASCSTDHSVRLWNAATGDELIDFLGHADGVGAVAFSPDGRRLATGCGDQTVRVWELPTRSERR